MWTKVQYRLTPQYDYTTYYPGYYGTTSTVTYGPNYKDWKERLKKNIDTTTYLSGSLYRTRKEHYGEASYVLGTAVSASTTSRWGTMENIPFYTSASGYNDLLLTADNVAKKKFLKRINQVTNHFQGGIFLGELGESLRMIRHPARAIREGIHSYGKAVKKRTNLVKNVRELNNIVSETWLEYSFGWKPLINDVIEGAETLSRIVHEERKDGKRVSASGISENVTRTNNIKRSVGYLNYDYRTRIRDKVEVKYRGYVKNEPANGSRSVVARDLLGFRWQDFPATIWELIPYSFLVDYFTNIGDVITCWGQQFTDTAWVNRTIIRTISADLEMTPRSAEWMSRINSKIFAYYPYFDPYRVQRDYKTFTRESHPGGVLLVPTFAWETPGWSKNKWANIAALAGLKSLKTLRRNRYYG